VIPEIEYSRPDKIEEVLSLLAGNHGDTCVIAGGTDIIPGFQQGGARFRHIKKLVDINQIKELKIIEENARNLNVGSGVTFSELAKNSLIQKKFPLLSKAAASIGSVQIRNRATIGGNIVNNAPCADSVPPLLVYEARMRIRSVKYEREIHLEQLLSKPYQTQLKPDELVAQIVLPIPSSDYEGDFYKLGRRRGVAISRITLAVLMKTENLTIRDIRIASGAVAPAGMRFHDLENFARGKRIDDGLFKILAQKMGQEILQVIELRWSSEYKFPVIQQMFYQLLCQFINN
jgi:xanthine dehydrogenase FAD-binding subunit